MIIDQDKLEVVLGDGTRFRDLIDTDRREVALRLLTDPEIYELELERLWAKTWTLLAHDSEIPNPGDFVRRFIGEDAVIVARHADGQIGVLLNVCSHRGMQVCRADVGNTATFQCPYHGWAFGTDGQFVGAPFEQEMYGNVLDKSRLALRRARVELYAGLVFATWDFEGPSLDEYLGDLKWYMDTMFRRTDAGMEVLGSPQRMIIPANWKAAGEQWSLDGYHGVFLHRSLAELSGHLSELAAGEELEDKDRYGYSHWKEKTARSFYLYGVNVSVNGHSIRCLDKRMMFPDLEAPRAEGLTPYELLELAPPANLPPELLPQLRKNLTEGQMRTMSPYPPANVGLFPNALVMCSYGLGIVLHTVVPKGPENLELWYWALVEKDAPPEFKKAARKKAVFAGGSTGIVEADDAEAWPGLQRSARGFIGRQQTFKYPALLGEQRPEDWEGGGIVHHGIAKDDTQWQWWTRYQDLMEGKPW